MSRNSTQHAARPIAKHTEMRGTPGHQPTVLFSGTRAVESAGSSETGPLILVMFPDYGEGPSDSVRIFAMDTGTHLFFADPHSHW